ncbi:GAF domain-containing protein [Nodosilinea sp. LEGE 06152]|uniref:GAF domain-containing protein n=1 Tax=Nodosilinea sp. LEGE 06152 TaxID=2777966 RepID=UPI0018814EAC|nr:GAF domain-containing protein [Nodosilinea sp. LEGE 06152]MBE9156510.1 GAF domain-containing protein [Nodosilinea sp. LEGE 06152]
MQTPPYPANEVIRLSILRSLRILDTKPEERFDRITRIAKRLFDVPITLVSLIDAERQWFKSCQGLNVCQTSRDISFCGHAILGNSPFVVPNALLDERFHDNPLVTDGPKIRFYAGAPLAASNGSNLGTLCVLDQVPRTFTDEDQQLLVDLGHIAQQELLAIQLDSLDELKQRNAEMKLLSEMSEFLQACLTVEEACAAIASLIAPLFPGCSGGVFTLSPSLNRVENAAYWGTGLGSKPDFLLSDCWGLRRGRVHWMNGTDRPRCQHVLADSNILASLCIPMMAQGETLGLFHLNTDDAQVLSEAKRQLAHTVAERVGMAIANLHLRKTLQRQGGRGLLPELHRL